MSPHYCCSTIYPRLTEVYRLVPPRDLPVRVLARAPWYDSSQPYQLPILPVRAVLRSSVVPPKQAMHPDK